MATRGQMKQGKTTTRASGGRASSTTRGERKNKTSSMTKAPARAKATSRGERTQSDMMSVTKTKGGNYPAYKKESGKAQSFRSAFAAARKAGKKTFTWDGRKYSTATK